MARHGRFANTMLCSHGTFYSVLLQFLAAGSVSGERYELSGLSSVIQCVCLARIKPQR